MKKTYVLNLIYVALLIAAFLLPRLYDDPSGGMAAAATSALIFLFTFLFAGIVSIYQFVYTYRRRNELPQREVILGLAPAVLSILVSAILFILLRYQ